MFLGRNLGHLTAATRAVLPIPTNVCSMSVYLKGGMAASYPFLPMSAVCLCIQRVAWLPATHSYQCVQNVCVFKGWYGCQLPTPTNVCRMSVYSKGVMFASVWVFNMCTCAQVLMHATAHQIRAVQVLMHATAHQGCTGVDACDCPPDQGCTGAVSYTHLTLPTIDDV